MQVEIQSNEENIHRMPANTDVYYMIKQSKICQSPTTNNGPSMLFLSFPARQERKTCAYSSLGSANG